MLSPRQQQILDLMRHGLTNGQIAARLGISLNTVKTHVCCLYQKLGTNNRVRAVMK